MTDITDAKEEEQVQEELRRAYSQPLHNALRDDKPDALLAMLAVYPGGLPKVSIVTKAEDAPEMPGMPIWKMTETKVMLGTAKLSIPICRWQYAGWSTSEQELRFKETFGIPDPDAEGKFADGDDILAVATKAKKPECIAVLKSREFLQMGQEGIRNCKNEFLKSFAARARSRSRDRLDGKNDEEDLVKKYAEPLLFALRDDKSDALMACLARYPGGSPKATIGTKSTPDEETIKAATEQPVWVVKETVVTLGTETASITLAKWSYSGWSLNPSLESRFRESFGLPDPNVEGKFADGDDILAIATKAGKESCVAALKSGGT